jgi:Icc-related predicted phosphoesterase
MKTDMLPFVRSLARPLCGKRESESESNSESESDSTTLPAAVRSAVRLVVLSDTHGLHDSLPPLPAGDVLIHCGDIANRGSLEDIQSFKAWLSQQPHSEKYVIEGNHDRDLSAPKSIDLAFELKGVAHVLRDETIAIAKGRIRVHGVRWSSCEAEDFSRIESAEPPDVLLTHLPPAVDTGGGIYAQGGSLRLRQLVERLRIPLHVFGHNHRARGVAQVAATTYVNAATINANMPVVIDFDPDPTARRVRLVHCPHDSGRKRVHEAKAAKVRNAKRVRFSENEQFVTSATMEPASSGRHSAAGTNPKLATGPKARAAASPGRRATRPASSKVAAAPEASAATMSADSVGSTATMAPQGDVDPSVSESVTKKRRVASPEQCACRYCC